MNDLVKALAVSARGSGQLPQGNDFQFHATDADFSQQIAAVQGRVESALLELLSQAHSTTAWTAETNADLDDEEQGDAVADTTDILLERVDIALDQSRNSRKSAAAMLATPQPKVTLARSSSGKRRRMISATNIQRPQLTFPDKIDNSEATVFKPKLKSKPNAIVDLETALQREPVTQSPGETMTKNIMGTHFRNLGIEQRHTTLSQYPQPYRAELEEWEPTDAMMAAPAEQMYGTLEETSLTWVDTVEALRELEAKLKQVDTIAIDLEAHNYRTYDSFACLMQVSTRTEDFLVDTLALRGDLELLNSVFTDPKVVKVLHGADRDIMWLQKDLGLYVVGMFDTGQATRVLPYKKHSLAFLMQHFCNVAPDKSYQLADWRIRPLVSEMQHYAREDTHYLLYIYDMLRLELVAKGNAQGNLLRAVWTRSRDLCMQRYEKPLYNPQSARNLYDKHSRPLSTRQMSAFKALHVWRDGVAREEDESPQYVLPDHQLLQLADVLPHELPQVYACCKPALPALVRIHAHIIIQVISSATLDLKDVAADESPPSSAAAVGRRGSKAPQSAALVALRLRTGSEASGEQVSRRPLDQILIVPPKSGNRSVGSLANAVGPAASSVVAQSLCAAEVLDLAAMEPAIAEAVERISGTFAKENLLQQLASNSKPSADGDAEGMAKALPSTEAGVTFAKEPPLAIEPAQPNAVQEAVPRSARTLDSGSADADEGNILPSGMMGGSNGGIIRLSDLVSKNKNKNKGGGGGGGGGGMSKSERKRKKQAANNGGNDKANGGGGGGGGKKGGSPSKKHRSVQPIHTGGSFNPYNDKKKKKKHGR